MRWRLKPVSADAFRALFADQQPVVSNLLWNRGVRDKASSDAFFSDAYEGKTHSPWLLSNMEKVVARLLKARERKESVVVWGDYDVDGVCGATILSETLRRAGVSLEVYIPDRNKEGYGLNSKGIEEVAGKGASLIVTVDCGMSDFKETELAISKGIDVIILDHHLQLERLPATPLIVNPCLKEDAYPCKLLAGAAVAWKVMSAFIERVREKEAGVFPDGYERSFLDLVALATVADAEPLVEENRALVKHGLYALAITPRVGLRALMESAGVHPSAARGRLKTNLTGATIAFSLAPRLNAASRMAHANVAFELVGTDDVFEARRLAAELEKRNQERQRLVAKIVKEIEGTLTQKETPPAIVLGRQNWPVGILGLVAGKLTERYDVPAFLYEVQQERVIGSARGVNGGNVVHALAACSSLLEEYGGHPQAAGFRLSVSQVGEFQTCMLASSEKLFKDHEETMLEIDAEVRPSDISFELWNKLQDFEPFGNGNPTPRFLVKDLTVKSSRLIGSGGRHAKLRLQSGGREFDALCFDRAELASAHAPGAHVDVVAELMSDDFGGFLNIALKVVDLKPAQVLWKKSSLSIRTEELGGIRGLPAGLVEPLSASQTFLRSGLTRHLSVSGRPPRADCFPTRETSVSRPLPWPQCMIMTEIKIERLIIYTDGGARGNPGPAAIGVVMKQLQGKKEVVYKTYAEVIGEATNNQAEYEAVIFGLKKAKLLFGKDRIKNLDVEIRTDSELLARQQTGEYKTEEETLWSYFMRLWNLKLDFNSVTFKEIPRARNKEADHALNAALNKQGLF